MFFLYSQTFNFFFSFSCGLTFQQRVFLDIPFTRDKILVQLLAVGMNDLADLSVVVAVEKVKKRVD